MQIGLFSWVTFAIEKSGKSSNNRQKQTNGKNCNHQRKYIHYVDGASEGTAEYPIHRQEQRMKNKGLGAWLDTSEVCDMLNLSKRSVQSMRERGELPYTKIEGRIYHRTEDIAKMMEVMIKSK